MMISNLLMVTIILAIVSFQSLSQAIKIYCLLLHAFQYLFGAVNAHNFFDDHLRGDSFDEIPCRSCRNRNLPRMQGHMSPLDAFGAESAEGCHLWGESDRFKGFRRFTGSLTSPQL